MVDCAAMVPVWLYGTVSATAGTTARAERTTAAARAERSMEEPQGVKLVYALYVSNFRANAKPCKFSQRCGLALAAWADHFPSSGREWKLYFQSRCGGSGGERASGTATLAATLHRPVELPPDPVAPSVAPSPPKIGNAVPPRSLLHRRPSPSWVPPRRERRSGVS